MGKMSASIVRAIPATQPLVIVDGAPLDRLKNSVGKKSSRTKQISVTTYVQRP